MVEIEKIKTEREKVRCPYCGYPVNAIRNQDARCQGVFFKCKNKDCKREFELRI
nr:MAG TPA: cysteine-rich protein [Caudoviricetes sp.]DAW52381.1 MAG TPA: cysteine-rich protein [Caudoviricetes sp.]DAW92365.1 MAG TPA: cysteine-rich protein [Bacteriophage sp.]